MIHTNHFLQQRQTQTEDVSHISRHVRHLFGVSVAGTSQHPGKNSSPTTIHPPQSSMDPSLTTNNTPTSNDHEDRIRAAVNAVHAGTKSFRTGICSAGKKFKVPHITISNCYHGHKPTYIAHKCQQLLSNPQKAVVIEWCRWHGNMGDLLTHAKLQALIHKLM